jgi:hypothetical protein
MRTHTANALMPKKRTNSSAERFAEGGGGPQGPRGKLWRDHFAQRRAFRRACSITDKLQSLHFMSGPRVRSTVENPGVSVATRNRSADSKTKATPGRPQCGHNRLTDQVSAGFTIRGGCAPRWSKANKTIRAVGRRAKRCDPFRQVPTTARHGGSWRRSTSRSSTA